VQIYNASGGGFEIPYSELSAYQFFFAGPDSHDDCAESIYELFFDKDYTVPWTDTMKADIIIDSGTLLPSLSVFDNYKFPIITMYMRRITRGLVSDHRRFRIETCGTEIIETTLSSLVIEFTVSS